MHFICPLVSQTVLSLALLLVSTVPWSIQGQDVATKAASVSLTERLKAVTSSELQQKVVSYGDAARGALLYYNPELTCVRCHEPDVETGFRLGPEIWKTNPESDIAHLIESLLDPSAKIAEGFQTQTILTTAGKQVTGLVLEEDTADNGFVLLGDPNLNGQTTKIANDVIDDRQTDSVSAMPNGLVGLLANEQSFFDLIKFLQEAKQGGQTAVNNLRPPASFFAEPLLAAYESDIDHAGLIAALDEQSIDRGRDIYIQSCARCHGTPEQEGSLPSALRFFEGEFKNGNDPYQMYQTLTHGYGLMVPQRWMVPRQKYDVIHFIRQQLIKNDNPKQWFNVTDEYLAGLPAGKNLGPDPVVRQPWSDMDYGNILFNTIECGDDGTNIAYKGIAIRLDSGPGGVTKGSHWMLYEHDTMRIAAAWSGDQFIDYNGIHFNDRHNVHPRLVGQLHLSNGHVPGWANPSTNKFSPDPRLIGRDDKRYGPLPESWLKYRGHYQYGRRSVLEYTVGETTILETPQLRQIDEPIFSRELKIAPHDQPLMVRVNSIEGLEETATTSTTAIYESANPKPDTDSHRFDGNSYLQSKRVLNWDAGLTVLARIKTRQGGSLICQTEDQENWVAGGKSLFIRDGRLVFDIGWVGAVVSETRVDDGQWHNVALVWNPDTTEDSSVKLYIDGELEAEESLDTGRSIDEPVLRLGFTADDFPGSQSTFIGELDYLQVWDRPLQSCPTVDSDTQSLLVKWQMNDQNKIIESGSDKSFQLKWQSKGQANVNRPMNFWAHMTGVDGKWVVVDNSLCLQIPASKTSQSITISIGNQTSRDDLNEHLSKMDAYVQDRLPIDSMMRGGPPRYSQVLTSSVESMPHSNVDPFVVDLLNTPNDNPWSCRLRLTGIDFVDDDTALVCSWDGSVWRVTGFTEQTDDDQALKWRRVAYGLFQPLGIRIVEGQTYVTCRDQLVALHDLNNDNYFDYYRCHNSDHQVTEHFHEFAMGLQSDQDGNFYYAKSARHALPALVPHHGTLLKIAADGSKTEILANGFRAANGVCLNPDGSFFVTDQEGHWTPKNRINRVQPGGFYGNMMGYHDVEDSSDDAMQLPLAWITNAFDRSPGELLWVPDGRWGPLGNSLLNLSYGTGQVFAIPYESVSVDGKQIWQGGACALPIPLFPTGVMRGRFHTDSALYCCGMFAWAGNRQQEGGLYRIRYTDKDIYLPKKINTSEQTISIEFASELDDSVADQQRFQIKIWDIQRTANYGSPHLNEQQLEVTDVQLSNKKRTVNLTVPRLSSTKCMEIVCQIRTPGGRELKRTIHNTIHTLGNRR